MLYIQAVRVCVQPSSSTPQRLPVLGLASRSL